MKTIKQYIELVYSSLSLLLAMIGIEFPLKKKDSELIIDPYDIDEPLGQRQDIKIFYGVDYDTVVVWDEYEYFF